jgi:hypothetical protein
MQCLIRSVAEAISAWFVVAVAAQRHLPRLVDMSTV